VVIGLQTTGEASLTALVDGEDDDDDATTRDESGARVITIKAGTKRKRPTARAAANNERLRSIVDFISGTKESLIRFLALHFPGTYVCGCVPSHDGRTDGWVGRISSRFCNSVR